jgi:hypothetical protein
VKQNLAGLSLLLLASTASAQISSQLQALPAQRQFILTLAAHEKAAADRQGHFFYIANERSERTGGHLWTERIAESKSGRVRLVLAEDGKPLSPNRAKEERDRLTYLASHPYLVEKEDAAHRKDEVQAQQMLDLLARGYLFTNVREEGKYVVLDFHPDPAYSPQGLQERVLHVMNGTVAISAGDVRVHRLYAHLDQEFTLGFGLLAAIHSGSNFTSERNEVVPGAWKSTLLDSRIDGRAILFKTISRQEHYSREQYRRLPDDLTVAQAVDILEK